MRFLARRSRPWLRRTTKHRRAVYNRGSLLRIPAPRCLAMLVSNVVSNGDGLWQQRATFRDTRGHEDSASGQQKRRCYREDETYCPMSFRQWLLGLNRGSAANALAKVQQASAGAVAARRRAAEHGGESTL